MRRQLSLILIFFFAAILSLPVSLRTASARERQAEVTLLKNHDYTDILLDKIGRARSSIHLACFLFKITDKRGNLPTRVADALIAAHRRGVEVKVLLESSNDSSDSLNRENRKTARKLQQGGITVFFDSPSRTSHLKTTVIDRRQVFIGSHNLTHSALSRNNELSLFVDSPELAEEVLSYFKTL